MLRADYKIKLGSFTAVENQADGEHTYPICIYGGNVLAAFVNHYIGSDGKECSYLYAFFADRQHIKNIEKEHDASNPFFDIKGAVKLNSFYKKEHKALSAFFAGQGHKVETYYEEPEEKQLKKVTIKIKEN